MIRFELLIRSYFFQIKMFFLWISIWTVDGISDDVIVSISIRGFEFQQLEDNKLKDFLELSRFERVFLEQQFRVFHRIRILSIGSKSLKVLSISLFDDLIVLVVKIIEFLFSKIIFLSPIRFSTTDVLT